MKVTIEQTAEGTFSVYDADAAGPDAIGTDDLGAQTAATVDEALQLAKAMLEGGQAQAPAGAQGQNAAQADAEADALFSGGFNQARGVPLNR